MRRALVAIAIAAVIAGCSSGSKKQQPAAAETGSTVTVSSAVPEPVKLELSSLPFKIVDWDHRIETGKIRKVIVGFQHLYVETENLYVIAVDRNSGTTSWMHFLSDSNYLDYAPFEAEGVAQRRAELERDQIAKTRDLEFERNKKEKDDARIRNLTNEVLTLENLIAVEANYDVIYLQRKNYVECLDRRTGSLIWDKKLDILPSASLYASKGSVFIASTDYPRVFMYDSKTGAKQKYFFTTFDANNRIMHRPAHMNNLLMVPCQDGNVYAYLTSENETRWKFQCFEPLSSGLFLYTYMRVEKRLDQSNQLKPSQAEYKVLLFGAEDHGVYAVDASGGALFWKQILPSNLGIVKEMPVAIGGTAIFKTDRREMLMYDVLPSHFDKNGIVFGHDRNGSLKKVIPDGESLVLMYRNNLLLTAFEGGQRYLYSMKEEDCGILEKFPLDKFTMIPMNLYDDFLYVVTPDGYIACLRETKQEKF